MTVFFDRECERDIERELVVVAPLLREELFVDWSVGEKEDALRVSVCDGALLEVCVSVSYIVTDIV